MADFEKAIKMWQYALTLSRRTKMKDQEAIVLSNLAEAHRARGELEEALTYLERARKLHEALGHTDDTLYTMDNLCTVYFQRGEFMTSMTIYQELLERKRHFADKVEIANTIRTYAVAPGDGKL